ncbi:MAG: hypothetical protein WBQ95_07085 [Terracidiphilus sp.]
MPEQPPDPRNYDMRIPPARDPDKSPADEGKKESNTTREADATQRTGETRQRRETE